MGKDHFDRHLRKGRSCPFHRFEAYELQASAQQEQDLGLPEERLYVPPNLH